MHKDEEGDWYRKKKYDTEWSKASRKKIDIYELWQQHKQMKTMKMSETWPDTFYEGYIHQFQPEPIHKIH